jgi:hypothetical protein
MLAALATVVALLMPVTVLQGSAGARKMLPSSIPAWAAEFMNTPTVITQAQAINQAGSFGIVVAAKATYRTNLAAMKAANPKLLVLVYLNGTFAQAGQASFYPAAWYARDAAGNKIKSVQFGNYLMDLSNPAWTQDVINRCKDFLAVSGYDGCFLDTLGSAPLEPSYVTGLAVDPATKKVWTKNQWLAMTTSIAAQTRAALAPKPVWGNGVGSGTKYFETNGQTSKILDGLDGGMVELFIRNPTNPVTTYRNETQWKQDVDMLVDAAANGHKLMTITKVWTNATKAQADAWQRYALASFLLGYTPGMDWFSFRVDHKPTSAGPYLRAAIGSPTGPYAKVAGVYQRQFTGGKVLVNPTRSPVTVKLAGTYRTLDGAVVTALTMMPHTGEVLTS